LPQQAFWEKIMLEFDGVYYTYPGTDKLVLNNLSLKIPAQKKCALIGQNGCGKTTLFLLANGLYKAQKGEIKWRGDGLKYDHKSLLKLRQKIGLIFQDPQQQLVAATVEEDISYGLCNLGLSTAEIQRRVEEALIEFGLTELAQTPVHHLSLGQKKRVSLADVMVLKPDLLLLDEPTAYLDGLHTRNLMATLKKIHTSGTTILMATHDLDLVCRWADWVFVMDKGQLILQGSPQDVFKQREILEDLQLGVPLIYEMLFSEQIAEKQQLWAELHQRILQMFPFFS
jgi:cobalt/nickel transport system ATP-binding protein